MSDPDQPDRPAVREDNPASDGLEERGQGAGRLLGEGAEQGIAADQADHEAVAEESAQETDPAPDTD